jgi:hypothetical protein
MNILYNSCTAHSLHFTTPAMQVPKCSVPPTPLWPNIFLTTSFSNTAPPPKSLLMSLLLVVFKRNFYASPCHHGMARPRVEVREDRLQTWRIAANKQSWTADKWWSSSFGVGLGANNAMKGENLLLNVT